MKAKKTNVSGVNVKISKLGKWIDAHKNGIITVVDRKAVNK